MHVCSALHACTCLARMCGCLPPPVLLADTTSTDLSPPRPPSSPTPTTITTPSPTPTATTSTTPCLLPPPPPPILHLPPQVVGHDGAHLVSDTAYIIEARSQRHEPITDVLTGAEGGGCRWLARWPHMLQRVAVAAAAAACNSGCSGKACAATRPPGRACPACHLLPAPPARLLLQWD